MVQSSLIQAAKQRSQRKSSQEIVIYEDDNSRAFFRFVNGKLEEYDLTRAGGKNIKLTRTEQEGLNQWITETQHQILEG
jgi:hypothetical protein